VAGGSHDALSALRARDAECGVRQVVTTIDDDVRGASEHRDRGGPLALDLPGGERL